MANAALCGCLAYVYLLSAQYAERFLRGNTLYPVALEDALYRLYPFSFCSVRTGDVLPQFQMPCSYLFVQDLCELWVIPSEQLTETVYAADAFRCEFLSGFVEFPKHCYIGVPGLDAAEA